MVDCAAKHRETPQRLRAASGKRKSSRLITCESGVFEVPRLWADAS